MKIVLVPTDFSKISHNAIDYAAKMALVANAKIVLLNVYHIPAMPAEVPTVIPDIESIEKDHMKDLQKIEQRLLLSYGKALNIELICKCGFAAEEISSYADLIKPDIIIMGITGTNYVSERLFGSVATSTVENCNYPILLVGDGMEFKAPRKIVLACDYNSSENSKVIGPLIKFAKFFKSHICVLNVEKELEPVGPAGKIVFEYKKLELALKDIEHSFHFIGTDDVTKGINEFITIADIDIGVIMPKKHGVIDRLFSEPNTKKMAFHSRVPLLTLPIKNN